MVKTADDPKGNAALLIWLEKKDDLLAGRTPRDNGDGVTVGDLCNRFLTASQLDASEITLHTFQD